MQRPSESGYPRRDGPTSAEVTATATVTVGAASAQFLTFRGCQCFKFLTPPPGRVRVMMCESNTINLKSDDSDHTRVTISKYHRRVIRALSLMIH